MIRLLRALSLFAAVLGFFLAAPGLLFLLGASQIRTFLVGRELAARAHALDPES